MNYYNRANKPNTTWTVKDNKTICTCHLVNNKMKMMLEAGAKENDVFTVDYFKACARKCDITGQGMREGYMIQDGVKYIKNEEDMLAHLLAETSYKTTEEAYEAGYSEYTEWEELDEEEFFDESGRKYELMDEDEAQARLNANK